MSTLPANVTPNEKKLLQRFEPIIRFTRGEQFFPIDVDDYVRTASLRSRRSDEPPCILVQSGNLTLENLSKHQTKGFNTVYYLQFIEPLNIAELAAYALQEGFKKKDPSNTFRAGRGRLARVGYFSRLIDAIFSLSLLARGRVPGDTAAASRLSYLKILQKRERYCYYGQVLRQGNWIILQYWYFYVFNNWRSGFFGVNDHEADWEMVNIYLYENDNGEFIPEWVAYANHDFSGDDLRRRWDDPELQKVGEHPVIYAGAGSHASYFAPGEYLIQIPLPFLAPLVYWMEQIQIIWKKMLRQSHIKTNLEDEPRKTTRVFSVPFVDYARGDGLCIGPGQEKQWEAPILVNPAPDWIMHYRGLWGYYARDPVAGENAPAGMRYNRDGSVRQAWYDPLGWAGLDKVPPPPMALKVAEERSKELSDEHNQFSRVAADLQKQLYNLGVEASAMNGLPHMQTSYLAHQQDIMEFSNELNSVRARLVDIKTLHDALNLHIQNLKANKKEPLRAHIQNAIRPENPKQLRIGRVAETWAALSFSLLLLNFVVIWLFFRDYLLVGLLVMFSAFIIIEALFRRWLTGLISFITILLALATAAILLVEFFQQFILLLVLIIGIYMIWENLRELWE